MKTNIFFLAFISICCGLFYCGQSSEAEELAFAVPEGKEDDYLSSTAQEFRLFGTGTYTLDSSWADKDDPAKEAHVKEMLGYKFKAYSFYINLFITDKEHKDANKDYGGFSGLIKQTSLDFAYETKDEKKLAWTFQWELEMGGPRNFLNTIPIKTRQSGERYFPVKLPVMTEAELTAATYNNSFNADTDAGEMEEIAVSIELLRESTDGFPEYAKMFEDGTLDILIVVGGDYNEERYDLKSAKDIFDGLIRDGFKHPAKAYTELKLDSEPLTKTIQANGKPVLVKVTFYHPDIVEDKDLPQLKEKIIQGYQTMDIVVYAGHAGQDPAYSGVVYHYNPRYAITAKEFSALPLPEKYQLFVFCGCKTYNAYPDAFYKNPSKNTKNLDIISTVNFSWLNMNAYTVNTFVKSILTQKNRTHHPYSYQEILSDVNKSGNWNVYFGVHGIDDNPHLNPYADLATLCTECERDSDCPGEGNKCVKTDSGNVCGAECTSDDGCPQGYYCHNIAQGTQITGNQCLPKSLKCE